LVRRTEGRLQVADEDNAYLTFGYEAGDHNAIEDEDVGFTHTIKVGLSLPFGANSTAANALNAHQTYTGPFRAGSWAATLGTTPEEVQNQTPPE